jgi:hypothetical protein
MFSGGNIYYNISHFHYDFINYQLYDRKLWPDNLNKKHSQNYKQCYKYSN